MAPGKLPPHAPNVAPLRLAGLSAGFPGDLQAGGNVDGLRFTDIDTSGEDLNRMSLSECEFAGWVADSTELSTARLTEVRLERLKATELDARRNVWREVEVADSRIGALDLYDSTLSNVTFSGSKLDWVSAHSATATDVLFRDCQIGELDFTAGTLERVAFENTRIDRLVLGESRSQYLDLRAAELHQIDGLDALKGVMISHTQAVLMADLLAARLGAIVVDG